MSVHSQQIGCSFSLILPERNAKSHCWDVGSETVRPGLAFASFSWAFSMKSKGVLEARSLPVYVPMSFESWDFEKGFVMT